MEKDHNKFDGIVRDKLGNLAPTMKAGSWEKLSQRIDKEDQTVAFDKKAANRLDGIYVPYQANSWEILAGRLALERSRIQAIWHYKTMEISLLLLLFLTAWQYFPINTTKQPAAPEVKQSTFPIATIDHTSNSTQNIDIVEAIDLTTQKTKTESPTVNPSPIESRNNTHSIDLDHSTSANLIAEANEHSQPKISRSHNMALTESLNSLPIANQLSSTSTSSAQQKLIEFQAQKADDLSSPTDVFQQSGAITGLEGSGLSLLDYGNPDELLEYIRPVERKTFLRVGFVGSPDYNRVITPTQKIEDGTEVSLDRYSLSYSGGITIGVEHGKWEIETGAIYAARKYQAIPTVYISGNIRDGYSAVSLKEFELNTIDIPLRFRYNFYLKDKWRMYAFTGISLNIVLDANYYTVDQSAFTSSDSGQSLGGVSSAERPQALKNKELKKGWIEGGSFLDNATPYANFGIGIERYMSYRWSVFGQPTYHHALPFFNSGLGPYGDKIHNFGINMGLKVRL